MGAVSVGRCLIIGVTAALSLYACLVGSLLFMAGTSCGAEPDLVALRHLYAQAVQTEEAARQFHATLKTYTGANATVLAYRGVAEALQARYAWSPLAKLRAVRGADKLFSRAVAIDVENIEIRFLRFTVEMSVPHYLGFSQHLAEDRTRILRAARHYPDLGLDPQSLMLIRDFMLRYGNCTEEEARMLRGLVP